MEYGSAIENDSLKIGDYITVKNVKFQTFLCAEGILLEDVIVDQNLLAFEDALFCIHLQRQYSASNELETFLSTYLTGDKSNEDPNSLKYVQALQRGRDSENKLNESYMKQKIGTPILFGEIVQLLHVKSGKFLTIIPDQLARDERENIRISLSSQGNSYSWLQILPRYKIDREGDRILSNTEVLFKVADRPNEFLHCSEKDPPNEYSREVNCSLETSSWKLTLYQNVKHSVESLQLLCCSQLVVIHDPESRSNVTLCSPVQIVSTMGDDPLDSLSSKSPGSSTAPASPKSLRHVKSSNKLQFIEAADKVTMMPVLADSIDTNSIWVMESADRELCGGPVTLKTDLVRFRNLNNGKYLALETSSSERPKLTVKDSLSSSGTLFGIHEVYSSGGNYLSHGKPVQLHQEGLWLQKGEYDEELESYFCMGSKDKNLAFNFLINRYEEKGDKKPMEPSPAAVISGPSLPSPSSSSHGAEADTHRGTPTTGGGGTVEEPLDVYIGVAIRNLVRKYFRRTVVPLKGEDNLGTLWPNFDRRSELAFFEKMMKKVIQFVQGYPLVAEMTPLFTDTPAKPSQTLIAYRQSMICDQGTLRLIMMFIEKLIPISLRTDSTINSITSNTKAQNNLKSEEEKIVISMGQTILHLTLTFLYYATLNNSKNQMVVGDAMPILLAHVGAQPLASKCVTDMLNSNMDLQEKKIGAREISIFTDKLRASKMNSMYLNLLRACCSCQGRGVTHNQTIVTEVVFKDFNDIIIQIHSDHAKTVKAEWIRGLFIPQKIEPTSPVMGVSVLKKGLPHLSLSWTTNSIDFSPLGLFGKLSVPIVDLYGSENDSKKTANKSAVAEYFIAELFLSADMCLGRNYHAIHKLEELFSYDTLVTILRMNVTENLKSAVVKLLLRLYVDRDPQVISSVPCLTRTWSEVSKHDSPQLPHVDISRENQFCLLQQIISEEIQSMRGTHWDGLSLHMMELLNKLIVFNFYGTPEKIQDVIDPLLQALDRRKVEPYQEMATDFSSLMIKQSSKQNVKRSQSFKDAKIIPEGAGGAGTAPGGALSPRITPAATETSLSADVDRLLDATEERKCWQKTVLDALESMTAVLAVVFLVILAISVTIATTISGSQNPAYAYFDIVVTSIFATEVTTRFYCHVYVRRSVMTFISSPLNWVDMGTVAVDLIILAAPGLSGSGAEYTKALRAVRLVRLIRLFRAARLVQKLKDLAGIRYPEWKMPVRYNRCPAIELETMVEAVDVLAYIERIIEDRNLSLLLHGFHQWESSENPSAESAVEIFQSVVNESKALTLGSSGFDDIFVDNIMLPSNPLTQGLLNVLMTHHSSTRMLLENAKAVQLLVSKKRERQYRSIDHHLLDLERYAGTNDIWGNLQSESDHRINKIVKDILRDLRDYCRVRCTVLMFDQEYEPDVVIQDLLRNLGFYDIAFKILRLLDEIDEEVNPIQASNNKEIIALCNDLLYWFVLDNPPNQGLVFSELEFFLETIEYNIGSHRVIEGIFRNNEALMKICPRGYIEIFTEKICHMGHNYHYLTFMSSITNAGEKNVLENQYEIVKQLIAPARLPLLASFCCPTTDPLYQEKVELMAPFLSSPVDISIDELPPRLSYHLEFLRILSGCTVGRNNITTVEAKVQSVFSFGDIIDAILDKRSLQIVNIQLGAALYNCMLDVEINIPGMAQSARMWRLIEHCLGIFESGLGKLRRIEKDGWEETGVKRQDLEWLVTCITIVYGFFNFTYDPTKIRTDDGLISSDTVHLDPTQVNHLISNLFQNLKAMHDLNPAILQKPEKDLLIQTLECLNRHSGKVYFDSVEELQEELVEKEKQKLLEMSEEGIESVTLEEKILMKYQEFLKTLESSEEVHQITVEENRAFIRRIEKLPFVSDTSVVSDVRYEPFIQKLVSHVRERLTVVNGEKFLDSQCVLTTIWLIRSFRTMIENRWGMSIYERDEDGGEKEDLAAAPVVNALNSCGATTLCLDLISVGIDGGLMIECVKLCVAMLFKEGGNLMVQQTMFDYLSSHDSELFFKQMRISLQKLISWHKWHDIIVLDEDTEPDLPEEIVIVRFLQLMCEGHFQSNQDILREQPSNTLSVNLLDDFVAYLNCVSRLPCRTSTNAASRVSATILEVIQGPCEKNQIHFVLSTELIETLNRVMRSKPVRDCVAVEEYELKKTGIDILQGLLEGQGGKKIVYERVLSVLHLDIIQMLCATVPIDVRGEGGDDEEEDHAIAMLQTESLVLLQMFCDYKPALRNEIEFLKEGNTSIGSEVACVEILWRGDLQRRFFHVPKVCSDLAKASKDNLVEEVDRSNLETKLQDFIYRSHELYREVTHQQVLKKWRISGIFSRANQNRATWISFSFTCIINLFMLGFYDASSGTPLLPPAVRVVVDVLNILQLASATFTLLLYLIVRAPVKFQHYSSEGYSTIMSVLYTSTDGMTVYYFIYVIVCALAINVSDILLTFLLLDIVVKNSTTRDVLYSVINPRKQLAMTVLLGVFVIYIFSFFIFYNFRGEMLDGLTKKDCSTLWKCFQFSVGYGLRLPNGVSEQMDHTLGDRYPVDVLFFLVVLIVLLNVVFGIIIDTFGNLRNKKIQRLIDTTEKCFVCGIDKQIFDRSSLQPNGFKIHITADHNMWNYLAFIVYVWEQDKDDDDGLEQYVRRCLESNDISWFPMNRALRLTITNKAEDELRLQLGNDMKGLEDHLLDKISSFQSYLNESIDKISLNLKQSEMEAAAAAAAQGQGAGGGLGGAHVAPLFASFDSFQQQGGGGGEEGEGGGGPVSGALSRRLSTRQTSLGMKSSRLPSASGERHA